MLLVPLQGWWCVAGVAAAVGAAGLSEALLVSGLGARFPLADLVRAVLAGVLLGLVLVGIVVLARRVEPRRWRWLAAALGIGLLALPGPLALHERVAVGAVPEVKGARPDLPVLGGLPLRWDERGVAATLAGAGQASWRMLEARYAVRPVDRIESVPAGLLLVAQPRPPGPAGLVALDRRVRDGGRVLLLVDSDLRWPSALAPGDPRAPPRDTGLEPLLAHWGLGLVRGGGGIVVTDIGARRIVFDAPGRFVIRGGNDCRLSHGGLIADCAIGRGRARLIADADWLHDRLWVGPGAWGADRRGRVADNGPLLIDSLAALGGPPSPPADRVIWATPGRTLHGLALAAVVPMLLLAASLVCARR